MTDSKAVLGKDFTLSIVIYDIAFPIFCAKSVIFEFENEIILRTAPNAGLFKQKRVRRSDWRGSATGVIVTDNTNDRYSPFYLLQEGVRRSENLYQYDFTSIDGDERSIRGYALISGIPLTGDVTAFGQCTVDIEGTGAFDVDESPAGGGADENVDSDYWIMGDGDTSVSGDGENGGNTTGKVLLAVARETDVYSIITSGTPGNGQAKHNTSTGVTTFSPDFPATDGEVIVQIWKDS